MDVTSDPQQSILQEIHCCAGRSSSDGSWHRERIVNHGVMVRLLGQWRTHGMMMRLWISFPIVVPVGSNERNSIVFLPTYADGLQRSYQRHRVRVNWIFGDINAFNLNMHLIWNTYRWRNLMLPLTPSLRDIQIIPPQSILCKYDITIYKNHSSKLQWSFFKMLKLTKELSFR